MRTLIFRGNIIAGDVSGRPGRVLARWVIERWGKEPGGENQALR